MSNYLISTEEDLHALVKRNIQTDFADLPAQKKAFAHEYIIHYDHLSAAEAVGRPRSSGISLLRDPLLSAYIAHLQNVKLTSSIITKDFINTQYLQLLDQATGKEDIAIVLANGETMMARKTLMGEAVNIIKEMSKSTEYAKDTSQKTAPVSITINTGSFHDEVVVEGEIIND